MNEPGLALRRPTVWLALGWMLVAVVVVLSLVPLALPPASFANIDKLEHALAYAAMTAWFMALARPARRIRVALAMLALGGAVELAQSWTGWRYGEWRDLLADAAGVGIGWLLASWCGARPFAMTERWLGWDRTA